MKNAGSQESSRQPVIVVVEDDRALRDGLAMNLRLQGYTVMTAVDGDAGMRMVFDARPDLVILDIMMPGWTGLDIVEELRKRGHGVPVLILSARDRSPDKVAGLNLGADDYMTKPFDLPELLARVRAMLRRRSEEAQALPPITLGELTVDRSARAVAVGGRAVALSAKEFDLLCLFLEAPGQVFTREAILERVWGWDYEGTARTVDNFVASLRKKLAVTKRGHRYIRTIPRVGYQLEAP